MSVFVSKSSPATGKSHWVLQDDNYDYNQEIARSAYADMLHDTERNKKYEAGLVAAIKRMRACGRPCNVLDIGTGTGLLSMMAVRNGADTVHACDAFEPAALCAEKIIAANGMSGKIKLIHKRSTEVKVPEDMLVKANILVTEVFDTELIGEGAIGTFRHALEFLLEPDGIVIPSAARMYIQPVESSYLATRNELNIVLPDSVEPIRMPADVEKYNNSLAAPLFDLQLSQLPREMFNILSPPRTVFRFDFCGRKELPVTSESDTMFTADRSGTCHAFFMWWDLDMDMDGDIQLSCAPYWEHTQSIDTMQWRDHWMQAVFYPSLSLPVEKGSVYLIKSQHDEYSLTFDIQSSVDAVAGTQTPTSSDILHCAYTRARLAMLRDKPNITEYMTVLSKIVDCGTVALCLSESSFLPFLLSRIGAKKVLVVESNFVGAKQIVQSIIDCNGLNDVIQIYNSQDDIPRDIIQQVTVVAGEPYFSMSMVPWDDLYFWYVASTIPGKVKVSPQSARLVAMAAQFDNLHKIRQLVGVCEGLDLTIYDKMIENARQKSDDILEPQSLWEYPCKALSKEVTVLEFDFTKPVHAIEKHLITKSGHIPILCDGEWNGVAVWMVYQLDERSQVSFGVKGEVQVGAYPRWNMERKQAVYLPRESISMKSNVSMLNFKSAYEIENGNLELSFSVS